MRWWYRDCLIDPPLHSGLSRLDAAMVIASFKGRFDLVRRLVKLGADPSAREWRAALQAAGVRRMDEFFWLAAKSEPSAEALASCASWARGAGHDEVLHELARWTADREAAAMRSELGGALGRSKRPVRI